MASNTVNKETGAQAQGKPANAAAILFNVATEIDLLREPLKTLAFSAATLAREPNSGELRHTVAEAWTRVRSIIERHSNKGDQALLAEAASHPGFHAQAVERIRARVHRARDLVRDLAGVSLETGGDQQVAEAARTLHNLTIVLDDIISAEEGDLLPALRRLLYSRETHKGS
jgi:hypothetical protein